MNIGFPAYYTIITHGKHPLGQSNTHGNVILTNIAIYSWKKYITHM